MVRRALRSGLLLAPVAVLLGSLAGAPGAISAAIGIAVVLANFAAHGLSLAWAAGVSVSAVHAVALGGFVLRMGVIVGLLFALRPLDFFSPLAFGLAVAGGTIALLVHEARIMASAPGAQLEIPPDPVAVAARDRLRAEERPA